MLHNPRRLPGAGGVSNDGTRVCFVCMAYAAAAEQESFRGAAQHHGLRFMHCIESHTDGGGAHCRRRHDTGDFKPHY